MRAATGRRRPRHPARLAAGCAAVLLAVSACAADTTGSDPGAAPPAPTRSSSTPTTPTATTPDQARGTSAPPAASTAPATAEPDADAAQEPEGGTDTHTTGDARSTPHTQDPAAPSASAEGTAQAPAPSGGPAMAGSADLTEPEQKEQTTRSLDEAFARTEETFGVAVPPIADDEPAGEEQDEQDTASRIDQDALTEVAGGLYLDQLRAQASQFEAEGLRQVGAPRIVSVTPVESDPDADPPTLVADVCVDASAVQVLDADGVDQRGPGTPDRALFRYTLAREAAPGESWRIVEETFPDDPTC